MKIQPIVLNDFNYLNELAVPLLPKGQYGKYQFEDEAFADWVKHLDMN